MTTQTPSIALRRACGYRKAGGTYVTTKAGEYGAPIEHFLVDPPYPIYSDQFGISAQGLNLIEGSWRGAPGIYDIFDVVGAANYKFVSDFVEEARYFGTSRQSQPHLDFSLITEDSRHFFLHSKGSVEDPTLLFDNHLGIAGCPKKNEMHLEQPQMGYQMCTGLLWEAVGECNDVDKRVITVVQECSAEGQTFKYVAAAAPKDWKLQWQLAIFMWLRPTSIEVIYDSEQGLHEAALKALEKLGTSLPYYVTEE